MNQIRAVARLLRGALHMVAGLWTIYWHFPRLTPTHREARVQAWAGQLLVLWGIRLVVRGSPPLVGPVLLVANHISWLDILVLHAARHCRFISKSDVRAWPLIGTLATAAGTLYIERASRRDAMRTVREMTTALRAGEVLAVFPEGTTSDGSRVLPFHANLLQAAIASEAAVVPVALQFVDSSGSTSHAPRYVGNDTLLGSVWRTLISQDTTAVVEFGLPEFASGRDRRTWARDLRAEIEKMQRTGLVLHKSIASNGHSTDRSE